VREWYPALAKPAFTPRAGVFAPVWTILYLAMGVASWRVWRLGTEHPPVRAALLLYLLQLALNGLWSLLFFGARSPAAAFFEISVLWLAIGATTLLFLRLDRVAGWLLLPYWGWVTFAGVLNYGILRLN
jgi:tryptophan-rich sensory protein